MINHYLNIKTNLKALFQPIKLKQSQNWHKSHLNICYNYFEDIEDYEWFFELFSYYIVFVYILFNIFCI